MIYPSSFSTDAVHNWHRIRPPPTKLVFMAVKPKQFQKEEILCIKKMVIPVS